MDDPRARQAAVMHPYVQDKYADAMKCVKSGDANALQTLLTQWRSYDAEFESLKRSFSSVQDRQLDLADFLLKYGSDPDSDTWLIYGAYYGHSTVVKFLLDKMPTAINRKGMEGNTPLYLAANYGHFDVVQALVCSAGVEVDVTNDAGYTPLVGAAIGNAKPPSTQVQIVRYLVTNCLARSELSLRLPEGITLLEQIEANFGFGLCAELCAATGRLGLLTELTAVAKASFLPDVETVRMLGGRFALQDFEAGDDGSAEKSIVTLPDNNAEPKCEINGLRIGASAAGLADMLGGEVPMQLPHCAPLHLHHEDADAKIEILDGKVVFIEIGRRSLTLAIAPAWAKLLLCTPMDTLAKSLRLIDPDGLQVTEGGHSIVSQGLRLALWTDADTFCAPSTVAVFAAGYFDEDDEGDTDDDDDDDGGQQKKEECKQ